MGTKGSKKKAVGKAAPDDAAEGLWVNTALLNKLHGRRSSLAAPAFSGEAQRLLHYADVVLGTEKKERFRSVKVEKRRKPLTSQS
jgi:hypothetical protein